MPFTLDLSFAFVNQLDTGDNVALCRYVVGYERNCFETEVIRENSSV
jgi:hypothetical protein